MPGCGLAVDQIPRTAENKETYLYTRPCLTYGRSLEDNHILVHTISITYFKHYSK